MANRPPLLSTSAIGGIIMANITLRQDPFAGGIASPASRDPFEFITPLFSRMLGGTGGSQVAGPRMDLKENEQAYLLDIEIPGVDKDAITVSVYNDTVTIEAEIREENDANQEYKWLHRERNFGKMSRTVALPEELDDQSSNARFENGVLHLTLQKKRSGATKRIAIS
jgi:HSP20 family protein